MEAFRLNKAQLLIGSSFLLAGALEYLGNRPADSTHLHVFLEPLAEYYSYIPGLYGKLGTIAPDFFSPAGLFPYVNGFILKHEIQGGDLSGLVWN